MKNYKLNNVEAAHICQLLEKIEQFGQKSPVILAAMDINRKEINVVQQILNNLKDGKK